MKKKGKCLNSNQTESDRLMKSPSQEFYGTMSKMYVGGNHCCWLLSVRACGSQQTGPSGQLENGNVAARLPPFNPAPSHSSYTVVTIVFRSAKVSSPRQLPHPQTVLGGWVGGCGVPWWVDSGHTFLPKVQRRPTTA